MGPHHVAADVRGVAAGRQGRGLGSVRRRQLGDCFPAHLRLHAPGGRVRPVRALPVVHDRVRALFALQRPVHPRDSRPIAGGDRELF